MGRTLLCGNWKMKLGAAKSAALAEKLVPLASNLNKTDIWVAPTFTSIAATTAKTSGSKVKVGAQNVHWDAEGAFTGEVSVPMLQESGCQFAITGHSERRHIFNESHELCAKRTIAALRQNFTVIFCIGETLEERKKGTTNDVLKAQMQPLVSQMNETDNNNLIIAYEPVWAIGTGVVAEIKDIEEAHKATADYWNSKFPGKCPPILYGGSVSPENLKDILGVDLVAGALIGGASLKYESMEAMTKIAEEAGG